MIFILLPTLHVWFVYIFDFACLKSALKETYCLLSSLLNLAQVMESMLGKIISCRNNKAIGMSPLFFFFSYKVGLNISSGLKRSYAEVSMKSLMRNEMLILGFIWKCQLKFTNLIYG